jgi:hypothetical protein
MSWDIYEKFNFGQPLFDPPHTSSTIGADVGPSCQPIEHPVGQTINTATLQENLRVKQETCYLVIRKVTWQLHLPSLFKQQLHIRHKISLGHLHIKECKTLPYKKPNCGKNGKPSFNGKILTGGKPSFSVQIPIGGNPHLVEKSLLGGNLPPMEKFRLEGNPLLLNKSQLLPNQWQEENSNLHLPKTHNSLGDNCREEFLINHIREHNQIPTRREEP